MKRPDTHTRLAALIGDRVAGAEHLHTDRALSLICDNPGIIPVLVQSRPIPVVVWADVGGRRFQEWKFRDSIAVALSEQPDRSLFVTGISLLASPALSGIGADPDGFLFHMSRCGSTVLSRALGRIAHNNILNESSPLHEGLWSALTDGWTRYGPLEAVQTQMLRNVIRLLCRHRWPEQLRSLFRFRSWNVLFIDHICQAFPETPSVFLYRDPAEVLVSAMKNEPNGYTRFQGTAPGAYFLRTSIKETVNLSMLDFCARLYRRYFMCALQANGARYLNYCDLLPGQFAHILAEGFNFRPDQPSLQEMLRQFHYHSKDDTNQHLFQSDREEKQRLVTPAIRALIAQEQLLTAFKELNRSPRRLRP